MESLAEISDSNFLMSSTIGMLSDSSDSKTNVPKYWSGIAFFGILNSTNISCVSPAPSENVFSFSIIKD